MMKNKTDNAFEQMITELTREGGYILYGAGVIAYGAFTAIRKLYGILPRYFTVTKNDGGLRRIQGVPVLEAGETDEWFFRLPILVATPEIYHAEIGESLREKGIENVFFLDAHGEYLLMSRYYRAVGRAALLEDLRPVRTPGGDGLEQPENILSVYMAKSHKDKKLVKKYETPGWIIPVQAGRGCTEQIVALMSDAEGENISDRNPDYCELTVTYWVWKNRRSAYKGICHYRRKLILDGRDVGNIVENDVDMVLPLPFVCYPNAVGQYGRYISGRDRLCLERAIGDVSPEDLEILHRLDGQPYYYDFNMLIAKNSIFDDYAEWMFSILFQAEKYCVPDGKIRGDRYAGYLGELLTTIYIFKNLDRYRIVHAERDWMV